MKIRMQRSSLLESMDTVEEIEPTKKAVEDYCKRHFVGFEKKISDIKVSYYMYDPRINWDTYIVTSKGTAIGFTDGPINSKGWLCLCINWLLK